MGFGLMVVDKSCERPSATESNELPAFKPSEISKYEAEVSGKAKHWIVPFIHGMEGAIPVPCFFMLHDQNIARKKRAHTRVVETGIHCF